VKPPILGNPKSICAIAESHKISYGTPNRRIHGGHSIVEANQEKQKVTPTQESLLMQFMGESADRGLPLMHAQIEQHANATCKAMLGADCKPVGKKWVFTFLDRHHAVIQTFWSKPLDTQCA
jgi:hypothetical protein